MSKSIFLLQSVLVVSVLNTMAQTLPPWPGWPGQPAQPGLPGQLGQPGLPGQPLPPAPTLPPPELFTLFPPPVFPTSGCGWDFFAGNCRDITNSCKGKCANFGSNLFSDCRCAVPEKRTIRTMSFNGNHNAA